MAVDLDIDLLRAFAAVAGEGGFTAAARRLHRSQPAVSGQIRKLEERLGQRLLDRQGTPKLTPAGELMLGYARRMLALNDDAATTLRRLGGRARVRIGVMDDYGCHVLPPLLAAFAGIEPEVAVEVTTGLTGRLLERLGERFDLVLAMHPHGAGGGRHLRAEQAIWIAPPAGRPEDEAVLPLALYPEGCLFRAWALAALDGIGRRWRVVYESHSLAAVEAAVAAGLAVGVAKAGTARADLRRPAGLPPLPLAGIALHRAPDVPPAATRLASFLEARLQRPDTDPDRRGRKVARAVLSRRSGR